MSFATVAEYEAKYGPVDDESVLQVWLDDATTYLTAQLGSRYDAHDAQQAAVLKTVCRDCTHRAYASGTPGIPVKSQTQMASSFSETVTYANPTGDFYLTKTERSMLGLGGSSVGYVGANLAPAVSG